MKPFHQKQTHGLKNRLVVAKGEIQTIAFGRDKHKEICLIICDGT